MIWISLVLLKQNIQSIKDLTALEVKSRFSKSVDVAQSISEIKGLSINSAVTCFSFSEFFSSKFDKLACRYDSDLGMYTLRCGAGSPMLMLFNTGEISVLHRSTEIPKDKKPELPEEVLVASAKNALGLCRIISADETLEFHKVPPLYSIEPQKRFDPARRYEVIRSSKGVPWGPGAWATMTLVNYTGEISGMNITRSFSKIEPADNVLSEKEGISYAARAILSMKDCSQTSLSKAKGKFITGNPFLGGQYYNGSKRVNSIIDGNLGVLAYEYVFGNDGAMVDGKYASLYEIIIDAKTGEALRIQQPVPLGVTPMKAEMKRKIPTVMTETEFIGEKRSSAVQSLFVQLDNYSPKKPSPTILKVGKSFWKVEKDGADVVKVDDAWYRLKRK